MIVLDENIHNQRRMRAIAAWYPGQVTSITELRAQAIVKDEAIPVLLRRLNRPTFVTTNGDDFWRIVEPHLAYCIVSIDLPKERVSEIPALLRRVLRQPEFKTKAQRMGKVARVTPTLLEYYEADRRVRSLAWLPS